MVDDGLAHRPKTIRLLEDQLGVIFALASLGVWTLGGSTTQECLEDGMVSRSALTRLIGDPEAVDVLADMLVEHRFWHAPEHDCMVCPQPPQGAWIFHDWFQMGYRTGAEAGAHRAVQRERTTKALRDAVWDRDQTSPAGSGQGATALCAYCQKKVVRSDRKSDLLPEVEHVIPEALGLINLVISCKSCNRKKGSRDPHRAGMVVHYTPAHRAALQADSRAAAKRLLAFEHAEPGTLFRCDGQIEDVESGVATPALRPHDLGSAPMPGVGEGMFSPARARAVAGMPAPARLEARTESLAPAPVEQGEVVSPPRARAVAGTPAPAQRVAAGPTSGDHDQIRSDQNQIRSDQTPDQNWSALTRARALAGQGRAGQGRDLANTGTGPGQGQGLAPAGSGSGSGLGEGGARRRPRRRGRRGRGRGRA